jgi:hypothetical protein
MKSVLTTAALMLVATSAFAGGGGLASSTCSFQQKEVLVSCRSQHMNLELVSVQMDRFSEAGNNCPRGGQIVKRMGVILDIQKLNLPASAITDPSTSAEVSNTNQPVSEFSLGGLVVKKITGTIERGSLVNVSATVNVGWGADYDLVNGKTFTETLRCD